MAHVLLTSSHLTFIKFYSYFSESLFLYTYRVVMKIRITVGFSSGGEKK